MELQSYQSWFDELVSWAKLDDRKDEVLQARKEFFERTGEIFEDDRQFEARMASFLEYFLFDRKGADGRTPAQARYQLALDQGPPERAAAFRPFTETLHGLYEVRKLEPHQVKLRSLFGHGDYTVTERRQLAGLHKGDVLEARLIPFGGFFWFSGAFTWHPTEAARLIVHEAKRRVKSGQPEAELMSDCARRALKVGRYRNIAVEKIYDFTGKSPLPSGEAAAPRSPPP